MYVSSPIKKKLIEFYNLLRLHTISTGSLFFRCHLYFFYHILNQNGFPWKFYKDLNLLFDFLDSRTFWLIGPSIRNDETPGSTILVNVPIPPLLGGWCLRSRYNSWLLELPGSLLLLTRSLAVRVPRVTVPSTIVSWNGFFCLTHL